MEYIRYNPFYSQNLPNHQNDNGQCSKTQPQNVPQNMSTQNITISNSNQLFANHKGMKVCLKRPGWFENEFMDDFL